MSKHQNSLTHPKNTASILLMIAILCRVSVCFGDDDELDSGKTPEPTALVLSEKTQQLGGIGTEKLEMTELFIEYSAQGIVTNLAPLIEIRQRYLNSVAQQSSANARFKESHSNLSRTQNLHDQDIVSSRRLQEQQAQWQTDKSQLDTSTYIQSSILSQSYLEWGDVLTHWFTSLDDKKIRPYLTHSAQILQVTLPAGILLSDKTQQAWVHEHGNRDKAFPVQFVSDSPQIDLVTQGHRYFFSNVHHPIPYGSHLTVWLPNSNQKTAGFLIPKSAVIRHMGETFIFLKKENQQFIRQLLINSTNTPNGYFVTQGLNAGDEIVTQGAQTILSQQLKHQIPKEEDD